MQIFVNMSNFLKWIMFYGMTFRVANWSTGDSLYFSIQEEEIVDHTVVECHVFTVDHYCNLCIGLIILLSMPMSKCHVVTLMVNFLTISNLGIGFIIW